MLAFCKIVECFKIEVLISGKSKEKICLELGSFGKL